MVAAVIVQARMASTRLPGKVLKPLRDGTVLREVLRRCRAIPGVDIVCCAVPESAANDPVAREAESCDAAVHRGHDTDVLDRYAGAARVLAADTVMRVTSDCPLIDPGLCG
jgi:spore coat polysaccharide biosynthesis protein SpsF (cytidylyltransferase family)